jgi:hypothetical protein
VVSPDFEGILRKDKENQQEVQHSPSVIPREGAAIEPDRKRDNPARSNLAEVANGNHDPNDSNSNLCGGPLVDHHTGDRADMEGVAMSMCIICNHREATIPDRDSGSSRKKLCHVCHAERLKGDIRYILQVEKKRRLERLP